MKKIWEYIRGLSLTILLTIVLFLIIAAVLSLTTGFFWITIDKGWLQLEELLMPLSIAIFLYVMCMVLAISILAATWRLILQPIHYMVDGMNRLAAGDFTVQMEDKGQIRPRELRQFTDAFNATAQELGSIELLRKDFINNFTHEFKTPITSLGGFADLILEDDQMPETERREYLKIISNEAHRLAALSNNVLALSKIESQSILTDITHFNLTEQLRQTVILIEGKLKGKQLDIQLNLEECFYTGNEALLKEVWINLLDNAIKFSPVEGEIKLSLHKVGDNLQVMVQDYGMGMDECTMSYIFDQFYQGDTSHKTEGNGLGLALVKKIIDLHNGKITVDSSLDQGSIFLIQL